jgi:hypothetical protein
MLSFSAGRKSLIYQDLIEGLPDEVFNEMNARCAKD